VRAASRLFLACLTVGVLAGPSVAQAGTLTRDGDTVVFTEADLDLSQNDVNIGVFPAVMGNIIWDGNEPITNSGSGCSETSPGSGFWNCGPSDFRVILGGGNDQFRASGGASHFAAISAITVSGGTGSDSITGGDSSDVIDGGFGPDTINGGNGIDQVTYAGRTVGVSVDLGRSGADDGSGDDGAVGARDTVNTGDIEGVMGGSGADDLRGRSDSELLDGGPGDDTLNALGAADTVLGGEGFDNIEARDGATDDVDCGPGDDAATTDPVDSRVNCDSPPPAPETVLVTLPPPPAPPTPPARAIADLGYTFAAGRRATTLRNIVLEAEPGARVTASCRTRRGRRCTRTRDLARATAARELRLRGFESKPLPVGAKLTIQVTKDGAIGVVKTLTVRRRQAPAVRTLCLPPGATRPVAC
jgi:Ca2+-binding RTX toxin-like protein